MAKKKELKYACTTCGSTNIAIQVWVEQKTGEQSPWSGKQLDSWCNECEEHVELKQSDELE